MKVAGIRTKINLGVFVLCIAVVAAICIIIAGDEVSFFKKSQRYMAVFKNTAGLVAGAPVRMGGVEVGRVADIKVDTNAEGVIIEAELRIDSPYFEMVRKDATVSLDTQGLLGDKFVSLTAGTATEPMKVGETIETQEQDDLRKVVEQSKAIMETVSSTTQKIDQFAGTLPDEESMRGVGNDFAASAKSLRLLMTKLSSEDSVVSVLNTPEARKSLENTIASLESAAKHADSIARKIDSGQGTLGALINDRTLYEDIRQMLGHIDRGKIARRVFIEAGSKEATGAPANTPAPKP